MNVRVYDIAQIVGGTIEGDSSVKIDRPSKIEEGGAGSITFLGNPKYEQYAYQTTASAIIVTNDWIPKQELTPVLIRVPDVYSAVATLMEAFNNARSVSLQDREISTLASIDETTSVGKHISVGAYTIIAAGTQIGDFTLIEPQVYIGKNVRIGKSVRLCAGVRIMDDCIIGDHCVIHPNTVIGSDGFGFAPQADGSYKKIPQLGNVIIESFVEIGSNTSIDRGSMGSTIIRKGVKMDNLIQVAHNVEIGENTVIAAQTGIAGSTKIGKNCIIGGQVGFAGHISIADNTSIQGQSGIMSSIKKPKTALFGTPAIAYNDYLKAYSIFRRLPSLDKRIRDLEKRDK